MSGSTGAGGPSRLRRTMRAAGVILGGALLLVVLAATAAYVWLTTPDGERWLKGRVLSRVNAQQIAGRIDADAFHVHGLSFDAVGLVLRAPDGEVVARADRLDDVPLLPLAQGRIVLDGSVLTGLVADVEVPPGELPLLSAVRPAGEGERGPSGLVVHDLRVVGARVTVHQTRAAWLAAQYAATGLGGRVRHRSGAWSIEAGGALGAPVQGPLSLGLSTSAGGGARTLAVEVDAPGLAGRGRRTSGAGGERLEVEGLAISPSTARAISPRWPLSSPVTLSGTAARAGGAWTFSAHARGPAGVLDAEGRLAPAAGELASLSLDAAELDVRGLLGRGPATRLSGSVSASGRLGQAGAAGTVSAKASGSIAGVPVRDLTIQADGAPDALEVGKLAGVVPGGSVVGRGTVRAGILAAEAEIGVADAAALASAAGALTGRHPALRGAGRVKLTARGALSDPAVTLQGSFDVLGIGPAKARGVRVAGAVARASAPLSAARLSATAERTELAGRALGPARVRARATVGRAALTVWQRGERVLHAGGSVAPDLRGATLHALTARVGGSTWRLEGSARVSARDGAVEVRGLALEAGRQRIAVDGRSAAGEVQGRASVRAVALRPLGAAVPGLPPLSGRLSGAVAVSGTSGDPRVKAELRVQGGPVPQLARLSSALRAARAPGGAVQGTLTVTGRRSRASAAFTTSDRMLESPWTTAVSAALDAEGALADIAGLPRAATGRFRVEGRLDGSLSAPRLRATADLREVALAGVPVGELHVEGQHVPEWSRVAGHGTLGGGPVRFDGGLRGAPDARRLVGTLRLAGADPGPLLTLVPWIRSASGRVHAELRLDGVPHAPGVSGRVSVHDGSLATHGFGRYRGVTLEARGDGAAVELERLAVSTDEGHLVASGDGWRAGGTLAFRGTARLVSFPIVTGWRLRARTDAVLALSGAVSPDRMRGAVEIADAEVRLPSRIGGRVRDVRRSADVEVVEEDRPIASWDGVGGVPFPAQKPPLRWEPTQDGPVEVALTTRGLVTVRGPGIDIRASLAPGFRAVHHHRQLGVFGTVRVPDGTVRILGSPVAVLQGSELRFSGPVSRPYVAFGLRGGYEPDTVLVLHGTPGVLELGLPQVGATEAEVFAALAQSSPGAPATRGPLPLVGVQVPFAELLEPPATRSYTAGTPLTSRLRIGASGRLGADRREGENETSVWLQVRLGDLLHGQAATGDAGATSADLLWIRRRMPPPGSGTAASGAGDARSPTPGSAGRDVPPE